MTRKYFCLFIAWLVIILVLWICSPYIVEFMFGRSILETGKLENFGTFSDTYGVVNSLFTGLALAAIVIAILIQSEQLHDQKQNLEMYKSDIRKEILPKLIDMNAEKVRELIGDRIGGKELNKYFYMSPEKIRLVKTHTEEKISQTNTMLGYHQDSLRTATGEIRNNLEKQV